MPSGLPPIGDEIPCNSLSINTPLQIGTEALTLDFRGGFKHRVDVNPDDPDDPDDPDKSVCLRLIGLKYTAEITGEDYKAVGTVTIEQDEVDVESKSRLTLTQPFPPKYDCFLDLSLCSLTIERPEADPLVLFPKEGAQTTLIGRLTQYPRAVTCSSSRARSSSSTGTSPTTSRPCSRTFPAKSGGL
ncbi:hypothetical protein [Streptomyces phaeochromogenes]|uniref:hypothetical protein n=1 Tax=Streptomyces phaeochromogenes TaxID=1923 RepID=UPI00371D5469